MLARLEDDPRVTAARVATDGERLLLAGGPGVSEADLLAACQEVLAPLELRAAALAPADARAAWAARDTAWLARGEAWRLSWSEAETFAERLLPELVRRCGEGAAGLRPLLVEHFFEEVRPADGSGPVPARWAVGAPAEVRRDAILTEAEGLLDPAGRAALQSALADTERVRGLVRGLR